MPEASVHKNDGPVSWKNDVRASRKPPVIFAEAESEAEQLRSQRRLKLIPRAPDCRHVLMPLLVRQSVHTASIAQKVYRRNTRKLGMSRIIHQIKGFENLKI